VIDYTQFLSNDHFVIFLFHGVITKNKYKIRNYTNKHLEVRRFERIIKELRSQGNPVSLDQVIRAKNEKHELASKSYAVTFDDGFANNLHIAAPILKRYSTPATFYITTEFIQNNHCSWTDLIEYAAEKVDNIKLNHGLLSTNSPIRSVKEKIDFLDQARLVIKYNSNVDPYEFAKLIRKQNGVKHFDIDPELDQKLTPKEVRELSNEPLFTVGGHSHTHRILSFLPPDELEKEVFTSINLLNDWTNKKINHYSYPEGLNHCFSEIVIDCLKKHEIKCCPTAEDGANNQKTDLFHLKRIFVN
jgi:peptidoglycan/xylan/chitin deacetylase (PgdA/CDA1 family)